jgi:hypothetical protein
LLLLYLITSGSAVSIYTHELLEKYLLPELKEIAQSLGITPDGNKTRRETWVAALIGQPFPLFQTLKKSPGVDRIEEPLEPIKNSPDADCVVEPIENSPGSYLIEELIENSPGVDRLLDSVEFPDLESALAEISRLRARNDELLELARSQSEKIRLAKDISPVEKPSLKRVLGLAQAACLDVSKSLTGGWTLSLGHLKRSFKKLRDIWDVLISDDWYLMDLFSPPPPPVTPKPLFAPIHSKYSAIPFCDDGLIDAWSLGVNAVSSGRARPAGGDGM